MLGFLRLTTVATMTVMMAAGCSGQKIPTLKEAICCDGGYEYRSADRLAAEKAAAEKEARMAALERDRQRLSDELAASKRETAALSDQVKSYESQLAERDRELTSLRSSASDSAQLADQLSSAQVESQRLAAELAASQASVVALQAGAGDQDKLAAELAATQASLAAVQAGAGDKDRLAAELAASQSQLAALQAGASDNDKLASELAAAKQRNAELETQLAAAQGSGADANQRVAELETLLTARDKELAGLRGDLSAEMAKLKDAQRGVIRALRPQIEKGTIMVDLNNERLLINLASNYLFGSGEDQLKPAGTEALKQVGGILKDFPEYRVAVDGHTDDRPIRSELKKKFPTNKELSEARAANAALALGEGGLNAVTTHGYADSQPVMPNATDAGRAKNRRVEIRVTK